MNKKFSELRKALLTSTGDGDGLLPYDLDQTLHEELLKLQPLAQLMDVIQAEGKTHEYRVRSSHPQAWFEGETTGASQQSGAYIRKTVQLKIQRIWGGVTGFAQAVDEAFIDALAEELSGSLQGMADLFEYGVLFGVADDIGFTGDPYQYSGILPIIYKNAAVNVIDAGSNKITLDDMDAAIGAAQKFRQVRTDPYLWLMGLRMKQVVDGLQTKVQLPLQTVTLADGKIVMAGYGGAPILETDYLVPESVSTSPAAPTDNPAAGGSLPDGTYTYRIASVTMYGEQVAGAASAGATTATTNNSVDLSWTADANAKAYMIFRQLGAGGFQLLDIINAKTYGADGAVSGNRTTYTDNGSKTPVAVKPLEAGEQQIALLNMNPKRGAAFVGMVDDMGRQIDRLVSFVELARVKDSFDYMLKSYLALRNIHANVHAVIRHAKLA